jgi:hypothetical protein
VRVADQPVIVATLILDVDTGLIRGLAVAKDFQDSLAQAMERALTKPAGTLPPGRPRRILAATGLGDLVAAELSRHPGPNLNPSVDEIVPGAEAEDIFDSFAGSMAGRHQPNDPPSPADWRFLFDHLRIYAEATPWQRWDDDIDLVVDVTLDGDHRQVKAVIMGSAGVQIGLALFPGEVVEADLERRDPAPSWPYDPETMVCMLDDPEDVPEEFRARAIRYGWAERAPLVPSFGVDDEGGRDFSSPDARLFAVVTAAVLSHDRRHRRPSVILRTPTRTSAGCLTWIKKRTTG